MFAYCGNNPVNHHDPTGHTYFDWDLFPNQQAGEEFAKWYINTDENEKDGSGKATLSAKIKKTYLSFFYNIEFSAGLGVGFGQELELINLGESIVCHYDLLAVQYSDGTWKIGDRLEMCVSFSVTQAHEFGLFGIDCFRENRVPEDPVIWYLYNDQKTSWTLGSWANYMYFAGGNISVGFDLNTFLDDHDKIWGK